MTEELNSVWYFLGIDDGNKKGYFGKANAGNKPVFTILNRMLQKKFPGKKIIKGVLSKEARRKMSRKIRSLNTTREKIHIDNEESVDKCLKELYAEDVKKIEKHFDLPIKKWRYI
jgi:hypothetical protein